MVTNLPIYVFNMRKFGLYSLRFSGMKMAKIKAKYPISSDLEVIVYEPKNPIEEVIGGEVKIRKKVLEEWRKRK